MGAVSVAGGLVGSATAAWLGWGRFDPASVVGVFVCVVGVSIGELWRHRRIGLAVMWGFLLLAGLPGLVLTWVNDRRHLPIAVVVVISGIIVAMAVTVRARRRCGVSG